VDDHGSLPRLAAGETGLKWVLRWKYDVLSGYRLLKDAAAIVTENQFGAKDLEAFGADTQKVAIIPLAYPVEDFNDLPLRGEFRARYKLNDKKIVMSLGRLNKIKGLDFLVESFARLSNERDDAVLVIAGPDDGYKSELEKLVTKLGIAGKVIFTGFIGGREKLAALADADIMVQPSRYEQAAWAPVEAVLCGTPVIVSAGSGCGEDVTRMKAGYLVNYGDRLELVGVIRKVLENPAEAKAMVAKAQEYIRTNLSLNKKVAEYEKLYARCIAAGRLRRSE
jgi:glycosyltransferase involved in cell wall biosynthesis